MTKRQKSERPHTGFNDRVDGRIPTRHFGRSKLQMSAPQLSLAATTSVLSLLTSTHHVTLGLYHYVTRGWAKVNPLGTAAAGMLLPRENSAPANRFRGEFLHGENRNEDLLATG